MEQAGLSNRDLTEHGTDKETTQTARRVGQGYMSNATQQAGRELMTPPSRPFSSTMGSVQKCSKGLRNGYSHLHVIKCILSDTCESDPKLID